MVVMKMLHKLLVSKDNKKPVLIVEVLPVEESLVLEVEEEVELLHAKRQLSVEAVFKLIVVCITQTAQKNTATNG